MLLLNALLLLLMTVLTLQLGVASVDDAAAVAQCHRNHCSYFSSFSAFEKSAAAAVMTASTAV